ncbi:LexA family protein [Actinoplanes sp. NPDC000266]
MGGARWGACVGGVASGDGTTAGGAGARGSSSRRTSARQGTGWVAGPESGGRIPGLLDEGGLLIGPVTRDGRLALPRAVVGEGEHFMVRVRDDVMAGAGIRDGDLVVVRRQGGARAGEIVAVMVEGEASVRVFEGAAGAVVLGRVVAVLRQL